MRSQIGTQIQPAPDDLFGLMVSMDPIPAYRVAFLQQLSTSWLIDRTTLGLACLNLTQLSKPSIGKGELARGQPSQ